MVESEFLPDFVVIHFISYLESEKLENTLDIGGFFDSLELENVFVEIISRQEFQPLSFDILSDSEYFRI